MDINNADLSELDRAQLLKFGAAALLATATAGLANGEAEAATPVPSPTGTPRSHPFTLIYQVQNSTVKVSGHVATAKPVSRVMLTDQESHTAGADLVYSIHPVHSRGKDEDQRPHRTDFDADETVYVGIWH